jgi:circadian clock protein KaiB
MRLYLAGGSPNSVAALANLKSALRIRSEHEYVLEIIDVVQDPERGVRDGVLVTPMLVKVAPFPERRVLGNLQDSRFLLAALGLDGASRE